MSVILPISVIRASNHRLYLAIACLRISGRNAETMGEVYDSIWQRRNLRAQYVAQFTQWRGAMENAHKAEEGARYAHAFSNAIPTSKNAH